MKKQFPFLNGAVTVSVPDKPGKKIRVVKLDLGTPNMKPKTGDFKPIRAVINVVLEDENKPGVYLTNLEQAVEIRVRYTAEDKQAADAAGATLALGFWDGKQWVRFTRQKHNFDLIPDPDPRKGGYGIVSITKWGDPPIGWGT